MKNSIFFKVLFFLAFLGLFCFAVVFVYYIYDVKKRDNLSKELATTYSISYLYSDSPSYSTSLNGTSTPKKSESFVVGIIKIDKIKLDYPILSSSSEELLKIAPCRFAGPLPNEIGNLCIAGHNYIDNTFFAKISSLEQGDQVDIYSNNGSHVSYIVADKKEVSSDDMTCTSQNTNGQRVVTLMTCNSVKQTRIIITAYEKT